MNDKIYKCAELSEVRDSIERERMEGQYSIASVPVPDTLNMTFNTGRQTSDTAVTIEFGVAEEHVASDIG